MLKKALPSISKFKLLLPSVLICLTPVFGWTAWKGLVLVRQERISSLRKHLDEQSNLLGMEVKTELERLVQRLTELGDSSNDSQKALSEADWGVLSFSVWTRGAHGAPPVRKVQRTQERALTPEQVAILKSPSEEDRQRWMVGPAFEGQSLLLSDPGVNPGSIAVLIVPLGGPGKITQVALAHVRLSGIQRAFKLELSGESFLINASGVILAHSHPGHVGLQEAGLAKAIFNDSVEGARAIRLGWIRFMDHANHQRSGVTRIIQVGNVAVVSDVPSSVLSWNRKEAFALSGLICLTLVLVSWMGAWIWGPGLLNGKLSGTGQWMKSPAGPSPSDAATGDQSAGARVLSGAEGVTGSSSTSRTAEITDTETELPSPAAQRAETTQSQEAHGLQAPKSPSRKVPERKRVAVLQVAIWLHDGVLMEMPPEDAALVMNDFFMIGQQVVDMIGGIFERVSGNSFGASWVGDATDHQEARTLLKCALALREEFRRFNEARKIDGYLPLAFVMGADWDIALILEVASGARSETAVVGDPVTHARALSQLAVSVGADLLVSQELWNLVGRDFIGRHAADATLSHRSGLRACYTVQGYRNREGKTVLVELPRITRQETQGDPQLQEIIPPESRWMVNTGSSILGPLTAAEVAQRLYALDLDFDSECWIEGKGTRLPLSKSGIFGGSEESDATYWIFDGNTIHGPMSEGFLKTALLHGAVASTAFVCQRSTINGWKKVAELGWPEVQVPDPGPGAVPLILTSVETSATRIFEATTVLGKEVSDPKMESASDSGSVPEIETGIEIQVETETETENGAESSSAPTTSEALKIPQIADEGSSDMASEEAGPRDSEPTVFVDPGPRSTEMPGSSLEVPVRDDRVTASDAAEPPGNASASSEMEADDLQLAEIQAKGPPELAPIPQDVDPAENPVAEPPEFSPTQVIEPPEFSPTQVIEPPEFSPTQVIEPPEFNPPQMIEPNKPPELEPATDVAELQDDVHREDAHRVEPPPFHPMEAESPNLEERSEESSSIQPPPFLINQDPLPVQDTRSVAPPDFHEPGFSENSEPPPLILAVEEEENGVPAEPPELTPEGGDDEDLAARIAASIVLEAKPTSKAS